MEECFIPGCASRYANHKEKVFLFKPPTKEDVTQWGQAILDSTFGENDYLCANHFDKKDIIFEEMIDNVHPKLIENAVPKIFDIPREANTIEIKEQNIETQLIINKAIRTCTACNCSENSKNGRKLSYYLFPINEELRKQWLSACHIKNFDRSQFTFLCSKHFDANSFENIALGTLKDDAVPTLFHFDDFETSNSICPAPSSTDHPINIARRIHRCLVGTCKKSLEDDDILYHKVTQTRYDEWIKALGRNPNEKLSLNNMICSKHFLEEDYLLKNGKKVLKTNAVPSKNLPLFKNVNIDLTTASSSTKTVFIDLTKSNLKKSIHSSLPFCIVKSCNHQGNIRGITYHRIPKNNNKWMNALKKCTKVEPIPSDATVCSMHFRARDFIIYNNKIKLTEDAVPKLNIVTQNSSTPDAVPSSSSNNNNKIKLKQSVLLSRIITPAANIVKSDFALIDINSIMNKKLENEPNTNKPSVTVVKTMHNYCNDVLHNNTENGKTVILKQTKPITLVTTKPVPKSTVCDHVDEDRREKNLLRKLHVYKKAYKKHKILSRKQSECIFLLENKLEENVKKNKSLEHRIVILEDIIQTLLRKRDQIQTNHIDTFDD